MKESRSVSCNADQVHHTCISQRSLQAFYGSSSSNRIWIWICRRLTMICGRLHVWVGGGPALGGDPAERTEIRGRDISSLPTRVKTYAKLHPTFLLPGGTDNYVFGRSPDSRAGRQLHAPERNETHDLRDSLSATWEGLRDQPRRRRKSFANLTRVGTT